MTGVPILSLLRVLVGAGAGAGRGWFRFTSLLF